MTEGLSILRTWASGGLVAGLLIVAVFQCVASAWSIDPTRPAVVLQATDRVLTADARAPGIQVKLCPVQRGLELGRRVLLVQDVRSGRWSWARVNSAGVGYIRLRAPGWRGRREFVVRLVETGGMGRAEQRVSVHVITLPVRAALIDLEAIRRGDRYEFSEADKAWLAERAAGCKPLIYVADVEPVDYPRLRERLAASGWPAGPLWMWNRSESYRARDRSDLVEHLLKDRGWLSLAVLADSVDNRTLHDLIQGWNRTHRNRPGDPVRVVVWPK